VFEIAELRVQLMNGGGGGTCSNPVSSKEVNDLKCKIST
jgi:hypothetical protein